jgi:septal ring factor EnvC (AmiA/AmiB activator)
MVTNNLDGRVAKLEKDFSFMNSESRTLLLHVESSHLVHNDFEKRLSLLERAVADQHRENVRTHQDILALQVGVSDLKNEITKISQSLLALGSKFDKHIIDIEAFFTRTSAEANLSTKNQERMIRALLWIATPIVIFVSLFVDAKSMVELFKGFFFG